MVGVSQQTLSDWEAGNDTESGKASTPDCRTSIGEKECEPAKGVGAGAFGAKGGEREGYLKQIISPIFETGISHLFRGRNLTAKLFFGIFDTSIPEPCPHTISR